MATGQVRSSTRAITGWTGTDVAVDAGRALVAVLGYLPPVHVQNDVDAYAFGELCRGAARGITDVLVVAVGTGIGASVVLGGEVRRGRTGAAGELGHVPVVGAAHLTCSCGWPGHLEAIGCGAG
ncbi:ROK family protein [Tessaracoccus sp. HDW20]|uniref:ROK family protein n=1 Tax=Tessaracoccus coleopterorum TaxID=2714950 RepID=UPI0018D2FA10|nr:ROK family protein [Tessaracoccus coleopterorum]